MNKTLILLLLLSSSVFSQNNRKRDSLLQVLKTAKEDSNKVHLLLSVGEFYENSQPETAKKYYNQSWQLSKKINYKPGEVKYASYYSAVMNMQGKFDSSLQINLSALQLAKQLNNQLTIIKITLNVANSYSLLAQNDSSLYYYMQTLPLLESMGDKRMLGIVYNNLTMIYRNIGQRQKGIDYGKKAIPLLRSINDSVNLEYGLTNLGVNYSELKDYQSALACFNEALLISYKLGDIYVEGTLMLDLGNIYYQQGQYENCKIRFGNALRIAKELNLFETETIALKGFAMYYLQIKNYKAAQQYADSALLITKKNNIREQRVKLYKLLSDISYARQDLKAARTYDIKTDQLQDSINSDNLQEITTNYEKKYETKKKEAQIQLQQSQLKQKNTLNTILIGGTIALLIILLLSYRNYHHKKILQQQRITELETEKKLTATEAIIKGEQQERSRLAKDLHDGLGGMLSGVKYSLSTMKENLIMTEQNAQAFENSIHMLDNSISEMRRVAHNMMPESLLRFGLDTALKDFCNQVNTSGILKVSYQSIEIVDTAIEQSLAISVYRIVQELLNNIIKHASAKSATVQIAQERTILMITVEDNGKGFDVNELKSAKGIGWKNILSRLNYHNGKLDVQSSPEKGTSVYIEFTTA